MDRLDEWRLFVAVATQRSFAKAAKAQGRSPQAATRAIAALEERLGARLLTRTTRSVSLTDEGARCLEKGRQLIADFEQLEAGEATRPPHGTLTVTAPVLFGQLYVAPIVRDFLRRHAEVNVRLQLLDRPVSFAEEGVDVGIRIGALPDSSLKSRLVGHVRTLTCASPAYVKQRGAPRRPEELAKHDCIAFTGTTPLPERWAFPDPSSSSGTGASTRGRSVAVHPKLTVNTGQAAIDAAVDGLGIARVLSYQVDALVSKKALTVLLERFEPPPSPIHVLQPPGAPLRIATLFADAATEALKSKFGSAIR